MLLAINVNNTNVKCALFRGDALVAQWRIATNTVRTADEYAVWLAHLMAGQEMALSDITATIIATVVPRATAEIRLLCRKYCHCDPIVVGEQHMDFGLVVNIDRPEEAGADRLINALAAYHYYGRHRQSPMTVVDFGTATTFDIISITGDYEGGIITPGVNLSLETLHRYAAKLPYVAVERPDRIIGKSTVGAMQSGMFWGYVGLIEGILARVRQEYQADTMPVLATGGLASLFDGVDGLFDLCDPDLTIKGLYLLHTKLQNNRS